MTIISTIPSKAISVLLVLLLIITHRLYTNMATQTALIVETIGEPIVSRSNWPVPQPGPKQIQVRVTVGGLNPHDQKGRDLGLFIKDSLPAILGSDVVGIVSSLGDGANRFKIGEKVFGQASLVPGSAFKALQEYAVLDEDFAARVPEGVSDDEAATLPTNLLAGKSIQRISTLY
jgi:NADPH2:quinone reductase